MMTAPRDRDLIDTLDAMDVKPFSGTVWRVRREGHDPTIFYSGGNRWDDGSFDVLYTAMDRDGALAEMRFHLSRGQPVIPSKVRYVLHELAVEVPGVIDITDWAFLERFGVGKAGFGKMPYLSRETEYTACQRIGEAIHFLGSDDPGDPSGFIVPNARREGRNLVLLGDYMPFDNVTHIKDYGVIDWSAT